MLVRHVEVDRVATGKGPAVIFYAVTLSCGKQTEIVPAGQRDQSAAAARRSLSAPASPLMKARLSERGKSY